MLSELTDDEGRGFEADFGGNMGRFILFSSPSFPAFIPSLVALPRASCHSLLSPPVIFIQEVAA
jgi:hypothetical protein